MILPNTSKKMHEIEKILGRRGAHAGSVPLKSATENYGECYIWEECYAFSVNVTFFSSVFYCRKVMNHMTRKLKTVSQ